MHHLTLNTLSLLAAVVAALFVAHQVTHLVLAVAQVVIGLA